MGDPSCGISPTLTNPFVKELCQCLAHIHDPARQEIADSSQNLKLSSSTQTHANESSSNITGREFDADAPYELRVLEVAFRVVLKALLIESHLLEVSGYPALDSMTRAVTEKSLRQVRDLKSKVAEMTKRVQTLRNEVDKLLKSDHDMNDMYLARRAIQRGLSLPPQPFEVRERIKKARALIGKGGGGKSGANTIPGSNVELSKRINNNNNEDGGISEEESLVPAKLEDLPLISQRALKHAASAVVTSLRFGQAWKRHALGKKHTGASTVADLIGDLKLAPSAEPTLNKEGPSAKDDDDDDDESSSSEIRVPQEKGGNSKSNEHFSMRLPFEHRSLQQPPMAQELLVSAGSAGGYAGGGGGMLPSEVDPHAIEAAEDLLESAFLNLDYVLRSLNLLGEQIGHDELLVRIAMDSKRNALVHLDLWVSNLSMGFGFVAMIAGIFGKFVCLVL